MSSLRLLKNIVTLPMFSILSECVKMLYIIILYAYTPKYDCSKLKELSCRLLYSSNTAVLFTQNRVFSISSALWIDLPYIEKLNFSSPVSCFLNYSVADMIRISFSICYPLTGEKHVKQAYIMFV